MKGFLAIALLASLFLLHAGWAAAQPTKILRDPLPLPEGTVVFPALKSSRSALGMWRAQGEMNITPYGEPEDLGAFANSGIRAVRFDPPFAPPYEITRIAFPSFTANGVPAVFPSVRLCEFDPVLGLVELEAPLLRIDSYPGNPNGLNEVLVNVQVLGRDRIFYVCVEFPPKSVTFPNDYPFLRYDARDTERGDFGSSFAVTSTGIPSQLFGNIVVSMTCRLPSERLLPIDGTQNLGANRLGSGVEFSFQRSRSARMGGFQTRRDSRPRTDLLFRRGAGPWGVIATVGSRANTIQVDAETLDSLGGGYWTTQAVDRNGQRGIQSNFVWVPGTFSDQYDRYEPNGGVNEATPITPSGGDVFGSLFPAGDRDYWTFQAKPGDVILAWAIPPPGDGINDMRPVVLLYNSRNNLVAAADSAVITYRVPLRCDSEGAPLERFTLKVTDAPGTVFAPRDAPRNLNTTPYGLVVMLNPASVAGKSAPLAERAGLRFTSSGPTFGATRTRFFFSVPPDAAGGRVALRIFDIAGRLVRTIVDRAEQAGARSAVWDAVDESDRKVASGIYYARLEVASYSSSLKVTVIR